ncbi:MAG: hypothetical protein WCB14_17640 [Candidatus Acidiferrales bacterium]
MKKPGMMSQVESGLQLAALTLAFCGVAGLFVAGVAYWFPLNGHSRALGTMFIAISVPVMVLTMNRWVKVMAGLMALAVLNGVLSISTGHVLANPNQPISRLDALCLTCFFAVAAALAAGINRRRLNHVDRVSILAFVFCFACLLGYQGTKSVGKMAALGATDFTLMGVGLSCLLFAWGYGRIRRSGHDAPGQRHYSAMS